MPLIPSATKKKALTRPLGVVEGFYGKAWSWQQRIDFADFLLRSNLNTFVYAPKSDPFLRKRWQEDWPRAEAVELAAVARHYADRNLSWGMGLSPYLLYQRYGAAEKRALRAKVARLEAFGAGLLGLLFDDMPGNVDALAERQLEIISDVLAWSRWQRVIVCPTYYSLDPVLQKHFGTMPENYWETLGQMLPQTVDVFWTGAQVCSRYISVQHLKEIAALLQRKPVLWDNYPVNDGAAMVDFLHMAPLSGRPPEIANYTSGHLCNPMNQALLSRYPLGGLAALYRGHAATLSELYSKPLARLLERDLNQFQLQGRAVLESSVRQQMIAEYTACDDIAAAEVVAWLRGEYAFDPNCLTG
ncbi:MAG: beta-N-acetylglucosaminidase domain-containing protein [Pseudomonadota bacterium]